LEIWRVKYDEWLLQNPPPDFGEFLIKHRVQGEDGVYLEIPPEAWDEWDREFKRWLERYRDRHFERL
jgi:hypothetical protein